MLSLKASAVSDSDLAGLVLCARYGWLAVSDRPDLLAAKVQAIRKLGSDELHRRGRAGRAYVLQHLTKEVCLPQVIEIIKDSADDV